MFVLLLKLIFYLVTTLSNLVTRLIFFATAHGLVLLIQAFKVPGEALQGGLEQLAEAIKACFGYFLDLIIQQIGSLISSGFDLFIQVVTSSASVSGEIFSTLVEKTKASLDELLSDLPEISKEFSEMISKVLTDLWENYKQASEYVTEKA